MFDNEVVGLEGFEQFESDSNPIQVALECHREQIAHRGMCKKYHRQLEELVPGIMRHTNYTGMTLNPSHAEQDVALESIDRLLNNEVALESISGFAAVAGGGAIAALIGLIGWIMSKTTGSGGSGGSSELKDTIEEIDNTEREIKAVKGDIKSIELPKNVRLKKPSGDKFLDKELDKIESRLHDMSSGPGKVAAVYVNNFMAGSSDAFKGTGTTDGHIGILKKFIESKNNLSDHPDVYATMVTSKDGFPKRILSKGEVDILIKNSSALENYCYGASKYLTELDKVIGKGFDNITDDDWNRLNRTYDASVDKQLNGMASELKKLIGIESDKAENKAGEKSNVRYSYRYYAKDGESRFEEPKPSVMKDITNFTNKAGYKDALKLVSTMEKSWKTMEYSKRLKGNLEDMAKDEKAKRSAKISEATARARKSLVTIIRISRVYRVVSNNVHILGKFNAQRLKDVQGILKLAGS